MSEKQSWTHDEVIASTTAEDLISAVRKELRIYGLSDARMDEALRVALTRVARVIDEKFVALEERISDHENRLDHDGYEED